MKGESRGRRSMAGDADEGRRGDEDAKGGGVEVGGGGEGGVGGVGVEKARGFRLEDFSLLSTIGTGCLAGQDTT